ncbi:glycosyltransferase family 2 protein [Haloferax sp. ATB1]|uniref:glycosyltransferase family 2 protein n=1 Tax=Haloferax sp. ATB1 TaxID=1508454 RepID=UPI0009E2DA02|nr:glycosyltransferase family 2 protein [Haloferax sp. ATB1]
MNDSQIGVIIVNWNNYEDTSECIESLQNQDAQTTIYLIDNGSTDGSIDKIEREFNDIEIIKNRTNRGFATAVNQGLDAAHQDNASYFFLANSDIKLQDPNSLSELVGTCKQDGFGIVSARVVKPGGDEIWFEQGKINWFTGGSAHVCDAGILKTGVMRSNNIDCGEITASNDYVPLCSALIDQSVYQSVGHLPEDYFLYYEDVDYCTKVREAGFEIVTDLNVNVIHKESASSGGRTSPTASYYTSRNHQIFLRNYWGEINHIMSILFYIWWMSLLSGYRIVNQEWESVIALWEGVIDGIYNRENNGRYPKNED